jgi:hypothetical protein
MDADQLDLKITGHMVTPGRVLEDGWIGVRGEIVAGLGPDDIFANASGIPGVQTLLPLAYAGVVAGQLTAGADADLVVLDPAGPTRLRDEELAP